ncbi:PEP-CTERM sorting domain-containing protein [Luteolibacter sp. SL250]|uniref:PEP-CTERM sorting domain-containing protein n=1 Tax=Luteolibacter sp. SL250 TaxID=2995170 RepID=UPI002270427C|nr:PEP-CTERM sorting domain-containing protein [Luteolibacter sp. SL250]WAC21179.1 PEP-CTERM sorting domain-containing protein [Luteolibacter sp. SL250]
MKIPTATILLSVILSGTSATLHGATVNAFWSAQTEQDAIANGGSFNPDATASTFPVTPGISLAGTHVIAGGGMPGGAATFQDFQGNTWNGVANATGAGFAFGWNGTTTVGSDALTISLNLTNIQNLMIRMDVRSAQGGSEPRASAFSAIEYSIGGGAFTSVPGANLGNFTNNSYVAMNYNLSSLDAIEGQSDVQIRFTVGHAGNTTSFRFDNIQLTADAVPEPAFLSSLLMGAGLLTFRRKRL